MSILTVENLRKVYSTRFGGNQVEALKNVNFSVDEGEYVAIMGESGSGKTTLLNLLAALDKPTGGTVVLDGKELGRIKESDVATFRRDNLGFVFQEFNLLDTFTIQDNILLPLVLAGKSYDEMTSRLLPIAKDLGLTPLLKKYPYEVSGGQKQRAAVARALITNPRIILADEPTGALDSKSTDELLGLFEQINKKGQTILMVTHSVKAASRAAHILHKDGEVFHQLYRGDATNELFYQRISKRSRCSREAVRRDENRSLSASRVGRPAQEQAAFYPVSAHLRVHGDDVLYPLVPRLAGDVRGCRAASNSTGLIPQSRQLCDLCVLRDLSLLYQFVPLSAAASGEFGLYNVLGMNKRNLARIVTWESLITAVLSLVLGLALGIVLSELAELGLVNMLGGDINYRIRIDADSLTRALGLYAVIFAVIWLSTVVRVGAKQRGAAAAESVGEKPPKANWLLGLAGVVILAAAYYLAVSITNPLDAIVWFFVAVILVIIGTYLLLVAGSVLLCRVLQKNKKYYYRPEHFVSVSSMAYRMKRNGAGLAGVCIIATMILVMISSSSCLYFGAEDAANMRYPRDINITLAGETPEQITDGNIERYRRAIADYTSERGVPPKDVQNYRYINTSGLFSGDTVQCWYSRGGRLGLIFGAS